MAPLLSAAALGLGLGLGLGLDNPRLAFDAALDYDNA